MKRSSHLTRICLLKMIKNASVSTLPCAMPRNSNIHEYLFPVNPIFIMLLLLPVTRTPHHIICSWKLPNEKHLLLFTPVSTSFSAHPTVPSCIGKEFLKSNYILPSKELRLGLVPVWFWSFVTFADYKKKICSLILLEDFCTGIPHTIKS